MIVSLLYLLGGLLCLLALYFFYEDDRDPDERKIIGGLLCLIAGLILIVIATELMYPQSNSNVIYIPVIVPVR